MNYINHYKIGANIVKHKSKSIATSLNTQFDSYMSIIQKGKFEVAYIQAGYEHRPDLLSELFYSTVTYDWLIVMANNIKDPFQELNAGDRILIPRV